MHMCRQALLIGAVILVALYSNAQERAAGFTSLADLDYFSQHYYIEPRPDLVASAMTFISASGVAADPNASAPLLMSFSCIFSMHEKQRAAWTAHIDGLQEPARKLLTEAIQHSPAELLAAAPTSPAKNDMNWACFFATGDVQYLKSIIDVLQYVAERKDLNLFLTATSAKWSLSSNAKGDAKVKATVEALRDGGPQELRRIAQEILTQNPEDIRAETIRVLREQKQKGVW
jgi:hypothetical protein